MNVNTLSWMMSPGERDDQVDVGCHVLMTRPLSPSQLALSECVNIVAILSLLSAL